MRDSRGRFIPGSGGGSGKGKGGAVQDIDHGWKRIMRELRRLDGASTKVGIIEGTQRDPLEGDTETDMVKVAIYNEFGTEKNGKEHIPPRPAHAQAFDTHKGTMERAITKGYNDVLEGRATVPQALGLIGLRFQTFVKNQIAEFTTPPNAPATQREKGRKKQLPPGTMVDNPLEDTGQMRESVRHVEEYRNPL